MRYINPLPLLKELTYTEWRTVHCHHQRTQAQWLHRESVSSVIRHRLQHSECLLEVLHCKLYNTQSTIFNTSCRFL